MIAPKYMSGRKKYARPQAMLFSDNPGEVLTDNEPLSPTFGQSFYVPTGDEFNDFIVLSDHNRSEISFKSERIENKVRTINGRMRSYHIADKVNISTSWENLPSRSATSPLRFAESGATVLDSSETAFTVDSGAAAVDILDWYENHQGSFWVFLSYDKFTNYDIQQNEDLENYPYNNYPYDKFGEYNEIIEVFFEDFQYDVVKRGRSTHDFWNISFSLQEV